mgnify:CR=1 FL=1
MFSSVLRTSALKSLEATEFGSFELTLPDGSWHRYEGRQPGADAKLTIHNWRALWNMAARGDVGFAEEYRYGNVDSPDLTALVTFSLMNEKAMNNYLHGGFLFKVMAQLGYLLQANTLHGSRRNIHAHYDLGNDFYKLWLDNSMTYSSALFQTPGEGLEQAQYNKYDRILSLLGDRPGSLLEIGCGWGGFADRALQKQDYAIKGITLSQEQHDFAQQRLNDNANIALEDYRHQTGKYDYLVSIEMFEAVGEKYWPTYFNKLGTLMHSGSKAVVQTITIDDSLFDHYRKAGDMIRSYIFPGGMLPSPGRFDLEASNAGLQITDRFAFGKDYAMTAKRWLENFEAKRKEVMALGFDEPFIRLWRLYLAACVAGFSTGRIDVMQMEMRHA